VVGVWFKSRAATKFYFDTPIHAATTMAAPSEKANPVGLFLSFGALRVRQRSHVLRSFPLPLGLRCLRLNRLRLGHSFRVGPFNIQSVTLLNRLGRFDLVSRLRFSSRGGNL
jgi:hypothetical protein